MVYKEYLCNRNYHKIQVRIKDFNVPSWKTAEEFLVLEGTLRKNCFSEGEYYDEKFYGLLKEEITDRLRIKIQQYLFM